jgi:hypothetical protein
MTSYAVIASDNKSIDRGRIASTAEIVAIA